MDIPQAVAWLARIGKSLRVQKIRHLFDCADYFVYRLFGFTGMVMLLWKLLR